MHFRGRAEVHSLARGDQASEPPPRGKRPGSMPQLKIRHLMILVVYVAVVLAWLIPGLRALGRWDGALVLLFSVLLVPTVLAVLSVVIPSECPSCRRRALVHAAFQDYRLAARRYFRCGICDAETLLKKSQQNQGCPKCGKRTLLPRRYSFHWCLKCRTRRKRLRGGPWVDAPIPQDDHFYWLWTPATWLHPVLARAANQSHPEDIERHEHRDA